MNKKKQYEPKKTPNYLLHNHIYGYGIRSNSLFYAIRLFSFNFYRMRKKEEIKAFIYFVLALITVGYLVINGYLYL